ncbi:hypothetical protein [Azospirillum brasilense]|uniref:hypothetical protein n=1 Tax=Azospirillum brasilense TaxID=192 RepID=UPI000E699504|nr:hypothetical protein [Azospirillum brasilense]NUB25734.1 hypothetical protein [Azospirillum brasilense]NUB33872.1 hypothetical protein [Azospirillum brasilense]RIW07754.1 hypothetical protein D2T81_02635 [Azospirillum brasilense]
MTRDSIIAALVSRSMTASAGPVEKAARYHEVAAAVNAAGRYAAPALMLVQDAEGDVLAAFAAQVDALRSTEPKASPAPTPVIRPSSWRREMARVVNPRGL